jgi:hypothetical protein
MKKKTSLLPMTIINRFEKNYGTIKGGGGKTPRLFCPKKKKKKNPFSFYKKTTMTMGWMLA